MTLRWKLYDDESATETGRKILPSYQPKLLATERAGGFDGIHVSFGDGCDEDTLNLVFNPAYVMRITPAEADDFDIADGHLFTWDGAGQAVLRGRLYDDQAGEATGEEFDTPVENIVAIMIY